MERARLVVYYRIDGNKNLYCAWQRIKINPEENAAKQVMKQVIKLIKGLPGWEDSRLYCLSREEAYFRKGSQADGNYKELYAYYYVGHENETTMTREEFCRAGDVLLKDAPAYIRTFFKNVANDPEIRDDELHEVMDMILDKLFDSANKA